MVFTLALFGVVFFSHAPLLVLFSFLILLVIFICASVRIWMDAYREARSERQGVFSVCFSGIGGLCFLVDFWVLALFRWGPSYFDLLKQVTL